MVSELLINIWRVYLDAAFWLLAGLYLAFGADQMLLVFPLLVWLGMRVWLLQ